MDIINMKFNNKSTTRVMENAWCCLAPLKPCKLKQIADPIDPILRATPLAVELLQSFPTDDNAVANCRFFYVMTC